ncbi:Thioredoxin domain-containing protein 3 [Entophlyctis sp. JEL0112]|nr:Thioredoxin domain-containing protein 3 [Entophlyctis sp. JEL0112]
MRSTHQLIQAKFVGPCEPMGAIFKRIKVDYAEKVAFLQAQNDTISAFEAFRNKSKPLFIFVINQIFVHMVTGANAPVIEKYIKKVVELEDCGQPHQQPTWAKVPLDDITMPIINFLAPKLDPVPLVQQSSSFIIDDPYLSASQRVSIVPGEIIEPPSFTSDEEQNIERTLALLKPDSMTPSIIDDVISTLYHHRFEVPHVKKLWLSRSQAAELYRECEGKEHFERLVEYMSCAPILAMVLTKPNAIESWREIVGPRNPKDARLDRPKSLRGMYGRDALINSFHASDGPISAAREIAFIFENPDASFTSLPVAIPMPPRALAPNVKSGLPLKTLAVIKPAAMPKVEEIISQIVARGYEIVKRDEILLHVERAQELSVEFLETAMFEESVRSLMSAPVLCLALKGDDVIEGWLEMLGPSDPEAARTLFPESLRAKYGTDAVNNGLHGSINAEIAIQQLQSFFPFYLNKSASLGSIFKTPIGSRRASEVGSRQNLISASLRASVALSEEKRRELKEQVTARQAETAIEAASVTTIERSLALLKPDIYPMKKEEILKIVEYNGFEIVAEREVHLDRDQSESFYAEHKGKNFFEELTEWMSSAPIYALVLEKQNCIKSWRAVIGPTAPARAREQNPESIRALFGTNPVMNAVHGSESPVAASREISFLFGEECSPFPDFQNTVAILKPDIYPAKKDDIILKIKNTGFDIVKELEMQLSPEIATTLCMQTEEGTNDEASWLCSGAVYVMILAKRGAVKEWQALAGPEIPTVAREISPGSIRALYGTDDIKNAVFASDSSVSAASQIAHIFGQPATEEEAKSMWQQPPETTQLANLIEEEDIKRPVGEIENGVAEPLDEGFGRTETNEKEFDQQKENHMSTSAVPLKTPRPPSSKKSATNVRLRSEALKSASSSKLMGPGKLLGAASNKFSASSSRLRSM